MAMKCPNCGYEYFSPETQQKGVCPACGKPLTAQLVEAGAPLPTLSAEQLESQRRIGQAIGVVLGFVVMVIGTVIIGAAQRVGTGYSGSGLNTYYYWDEAQLEWGILLALLGAIVLLVSLVSIVVIHSRKSV
jgi:transcription initiation factor TFIIIB Brf1 subunit/transcription initiation factor TFIIB